MCHSSSKNRYRVERGIMNDPIRRDLRLRSGKSPTSAFPCDTHRAYGPVRIDPEPFTFRFILNRHSFCYIPVMLLMVIETFKNGDPQPIRQRFLRDGRMLPEGVVYHASW